MCSSSHRSSTATDGFNSSIDHTRRHTDDFCFEFHDTGPYVRMQRIGDGIHPEGLVQEGNVVVLTMINGT